MSQGRKRHDAPSLSAEGTEEAPEAPAVPTH